MNEVLSCTVHVLTQYAQGKGHTAMFSHFTDQETEIQTVEEASPRSHSWEIAGLDESP